MELAEKSSLQKQRERNYGIDLLRLISMLMVVFLHVLGQGGVLKSAGNLTLKGEIFWLVEIACYGAVNVYAIISGYVGIKSRHKYSSLISLCLQVVFYSLTVTAFELVMSWSTSTPIEAKTILSHLFPTVKDYWYFSAYFCLFFLMPLLNGIVNLLPRRTLKTAGIFAFLVFSCWSVFSSVVSSFSSGYSVWWIAILYLAGAYFAKYNPLEKWSAKRCFFSYLVCVLLTELSRIAIGFGTKWATGKVQHIKAFVVYTSPTIVLGAVFLFYAFVKMRVGEKISRVIGFLSPMAFGVYLVHCHPYVYGKLKGVLIPVVEEAIWMAILKISGFALLIFAGCILIDWLRLLLFKVIKVKEISCGLEKILSRLFARVFKLTDRE